MRRRRTSRLAAILLVQATAIDALQVVSDLDRGDIDSSSASSEGSNELWIEPSGSKSFSQENQLAGSLASELLVPWEPEAIDVEVPDLLKLPIERIAMELATSPPSDPSSTSPTSASPAEPFDPSESLVTADTTWPSDASGSDPEPCDDCDLAPVLTKPSDTSGVSNPSPSPPTVSPPDPTSSRSHPVATDTTTAAAVRTKRPMPTPAPTTMAVFTDDPLTNTPLETPRESLRGSDQASSLNTTETDPTPLPWQFAIPDLQLDATVTGPSTQMLLDSINQEEVREFTRNVPQNTPKGDSDNDSKSLKNLSVAKTNKTNDTPSSTVLPDKLLVKGGRHANRPVDYDTSTAVSGSERVVQEFLRGFASLLAAIALVLLVFNYYVSLDAMLSWNSSSSWSPNNWEVMFFVGFLQQMASISQLSLSNAPSFLLRFADSFAWTSFLLPGDHRVSDAVNNKTRQLTVVFEMNGMTAYADRLGIQESSVMYRSLVGFVVVMGILLLCFLGVAFVAKFKAERDDVTRLTVDAYTSMRTNLASPSLVQSIRRTSVRTLGLCLLVWFFALFPLSMTSSYELYMVISSWSTQAVVVAMLVLVGVCFGGVIACVIAVVTKTMAQLEQFENLATWGSLYCDLVYSRRLFFVVTAVFQITCGCCIGAIHNERLQLVVLVILEVVHVIAVFLFDAFADAFVMRMAYALGAVRVTNYSLAFCFLKRVSMAGTSRKTVAKVFIFLNALVILLWFVRLLVMFSAYVRVWLKLKAPSGSVFSTSSCFTQAAMNEECTENALTTTMQQLASSHCQVRQGGVIASIKAKEMHLHGAVV